MFGGDPPIAKSHVPYSLPSDGPSTFEHNGVKMSLPLVTSALFPTCDGLDVQAFIKSLVASNPTRAESITPRAIDTAVAEFAAQRFPGAVPWLKDQFLEQVRLTASSMITLCMSSSHVP